VEPKTSETERRRAMDSTLVLNASYEPLSIVSLNRAVILVLKERAEVVETSGDLRSAHETMPKPTVIRLRKYINIPVSKRLLPPSRANILRRDQRTCGYCLKAGNTIDHILPRAKGGTTTWTNVVTACALCNNKKGDRTLEELGWKLHFTPKPVYSSTRIVVAVQAREPSWRPYLEAYSRA